MLGLRSGTKLEKVSVNCLLDKGGLGDNICRIPAVKYILLHYPHVFLKIIAPPYFEDLCHNFLRDFKGKYEYINFLDVSSIKENDPAIRADCPQHTNLGYDMVTHAFNVLVDRQPQLHERNHPTLDLSSVDLSKFYLPKNYVVITPCFTSKTRIFDPKAFIEVCEYFQAKNILPVFLGSNETTYSQKTKIMGFIAEELRETLKKGADLINHTTLLEAAKIMSGAKCVFGVDNGLIHLAACTEVPIVAGYTTVKPEHRTLIRHNEPFWRAKVVVPAQTLECRFCQSNFHFLFHHIYTKCYYKDYKCIQQLSAGKWIKAYEDLK